MHVTAAAAKAKTAAAAKTAPAPKAYEEPYAPRRASVRLQARSLSSAPSSSDNDNPLFYRVGSSDSSFEEGPLTDEDGAADAASASDVFSTAFNTEDNFVRQ